MRARWWMAVALTAAACKTAGGGDDTDETDTDRAPDTDLPPDTDTDLPADTDDTDVGGPLTCTSTAIPLGPAVTAGWSGASACDVSSERTCTWSDASDTACAGGVADLVFLRKDDSSARRLVLDARWEVVAKSHGTLATVDGHVELTDLPEDTDLSFTLERTDDSDIIDVNVKFDGLTLQVEWIGGTL